MAYCPNCGSNIESGNYCPNCGAQLNATQKNSGISTAGKVVGTVVGVSALSHVLHRVTRPRRPMPPRGGPHGMGPGHR